MADRRWASTLVSTVAATSLLLVPSSAGAAPAAPVPEIARVQPAGPSPATERALLVQRRLQESRAAHHRAVQRLDLLEQYHALRSAQADRAVEDAAQVAAEVDASSGVLDAVQAWASGDDELERADDAMREAEHLREIATITGEGVVGARRDVRATGRAYDAARSAAERLQLSTAARASARLALRWSTLPSDYRASGAMQDQRNRRALADWRRRVSAVGSAGIAPPSAEVLEQRRLPGELRPLVDGGGRRITGVGVVRGWNGATVEVVPDVSVRAVSAAFAGLGVRPAEERTCAQFVQGIWDTAQVDVASDGAALWQSLTPVSERQVVAGDVVFFRRHSGHGLGISVGGRKVVALDQASGEVAVERVAPTEVLAVRRVTLSPERGVRGAAVPSIVSRGCVPPHAEPPVAAKAGLPGGGWSLPVSEGSYSMSAGFGIAGTLWSSGSHMGQDFAAPMGTPVTTAAAGRVTVERVSWAGQLVRIDHGSGVETWYAHMSRVDVDTGETVAAGATVGAVGSEGNSTGPHLHFEVRVDGVAVDPVPFLSRRGSS